VRTVISIALGIVLAYTGILGRSDVSVSSSKAPNAPWTRGQKRRGSGNREGRSSFPPS